MKMHRLLQSSRAGNRPGVNHISYLSAYKSHVLLIALAAGEVIRVNSKTKGVVIHLGFPVVLRFQNSLFNDSQCV